MSSELTSRDIYNNQTGDSSSTVSTLIALQPSSADELQTVISYHSSTSVAPQTSSSSGHDNRVFGVVPAPAPTSRLALEKLQSEWREFDLEGRRTLLDSQAQAIASGHDTPK